jgi:hypothetical protein
MGKKRYPDDSKWKENLPIGLLLPDDLDSAYRYVLARMNLLIFQEKREVVAKLNLISSLRGPISHGLDLICLHDAGKL